MKTNDSLYFTYFSDGKMEYVGHEFFPTTLNEKIRCVDNNSLEYFSVENESFDENSGDLELFRNKYDPYNDRWMIDDIKEQSLQSENIIDGKASLLVYTNAHWKGTITDSGEDSFTVEREASPIEERLTVFPLGKVPFNCQDSGKYDVQIMNIPYDYGTGYSDGHEFLFVGVVKNKQVLDYGSTSVKNGVVKLTGDCYTTSISLNNDKGGGCLIATATYGSELAPQVQQLRELRDNSLLQTESGTSFMTGFNQFYYSFSPTIADWERESPIFKEAVKIVITPMLSTLSIMTLADSEVEVLELGLSVIALNIGMYFVAPAVVIHTIRKKF